MSRSVLWEDPRGTAQLFFLVSCQNLLRAIIVLVGAALSFVLIGCALSSPRFTSDKPLGGQTRAD